MLIDPERIILGGGIGLSAGFVDDLADRLRLLDRARRPTVRAAGPGPFAGVIGAAAFAETSGALTS